jgi:hypothetical protein
MTGEAARRRAKNNSSIEIFFLARRFTGLPNLRGFQDDTGCLEITTAELHEIAFLAIPARAFSGGAMPHLEFHPLANVLPLMSGKEFDNLVASIKACGLNRAIVLYEGKILDGRNRYRACIEAKIELRTREFEGDDPIQFVAAENLHRRHLDPHQQAMAMADYARFKKGRPQGVGKMEESKNGQPCPVLSNADAAKLAGVSPRTIKNAKVVLDEGTPAEAQACRDGNTGIESTAKAIRARRPQASDFKASTAPVFTDDAAKKKNKALNDLAIVAFSPHRQTPARAASLLMSPRLAKRWGSAPGIARRLRGFAAWINNIAEELESANDRAHRQAS